MKRGKKMGLLLAVLCILLVGYGYISGMETSTEVAESAGIFPLWQEDAAVASLTWMLDGAEMTFAKGESVWQKAGDPSFPVNQTVIENLVGKIEVLQASKELTDVQNLGDYGLDEPAFTVKVKDADGNETTYAMGDSTPFADGYYISVSGKESVYVIADSLADTFDKTLTQLASMEDMPVVTNVTRLTVGDTLDVSLNEASGTWSDTATGEVLDTDAVQTLADGASSLAWRSLIATSATDEELAAWKLDDAQAVKVTLYNGETAEFELLLGDKDAEGDRYARLPDSRMVYTFYSDDADDLLEASLDTLWKKELVSLTADALGTAAFAWDGGEATLTAEDVEATTTQSVIEHLTAIQGTDRVLLGDELGETVLKVTVTDAESNVQELVFYAHNVDSYLVKITDTHGILVPAGDVDTLIRVLKTIQ